MKKRFIAMLLASMMVFVIGTTAFASSGSWQYDGYGWWYAYDEGGYAVSRWENIDGFWYYFNNSGYMYTGWLWDGNTWYLLNPDGTMATGWVWDGAWYYLYPTGTLATGWITDGYSWYYMGIDGAMQTGWIWDGYNWYYMNDNGTMYTGWLWDGAWYYLNASGVMVTGRQIIDGITYNFDASGVWIENGTNLYDHNTITNMAKDVMKRLNALDNYGCIAFNIDVSPDVRRQQIGYPIQLIPCLIKDYNTIGEAISLQKEYISETVRPLQTDRMREYNGRLYGSIIQADMNPFAIDTLYVTAYDENSVTAECSVDLNGIYLPYRLYFSYYNNHLKLESWDRIRR